MRIRFDRGTLVCEPDDDNDDLSALPGAVWDDEHRAWRVSAARYAEATRWLIVQGVRFSDNLPDWRIAVRWAPPPLQWYQTSALDRWQATELRGVIAVPEGPERMLLALAAITRLGVATLCLVPDLRSLETWRRALAEGTGLSIGKLGDGAPRVAMLTVATFAAAAVWAPQLGDKFGLVIIDGRGVPPAGSAAEGQRSSIDEAHQVGAGCPAELLELLVAPARLGLTSLPPEAPAVLDRNVGPTVSAHTQVELRVPDAPPRQRPRARLEPIAGGAS